MSESNQEILKWLSTLHLPHYSSCLEEGGYQTLQDCRDLTDIRLFELGVFPTGHRRRILRSLEALGVLLPSEDEEDEGDANGRRRRKPVPNPRHIFKDKKRGLSCHLTKKIEFDLEGSQTLPPSAGLGIETKEEKRFLKPPQPAPRNPQNIGICYAPSTSGSSSSESLSISEMPSDWEVSSENSTLLITESTSCPTVVPNTLSEEDNENFEMVENSIYESQPGFLLSKGPRPTRSYRLRHRPVPEIPSLVILPTLPQDRNAPLTQLMSPEHLTISEGPTGANGIQKDPLQRTLPPIVPYGETFLYNNFENTPDQGEKDGLQMDLKDKTKPKKLRKPPKPKESKDKALPPLPPSATIQDTDTDEYSTVEECTKTLGRAIIDQSLEVTGEVTSAPVPQDGSMVVVECDLYSQSTDVLSGASKTVLPDISPYACFYGAPKHEVFKAGWLDKLSPQGKCVFQRRWVRFDGESLAYYNNEKLGSVNVGGKDRAT